MPTAVNSTYNLKITGYCLGAVKEEYQESQYGQILFNATRENAGRTFSIT